MITGEHVVETIACIVVALWLLSFVMRRWRMRGRSRARDRREMQDSIRRFNRRDTNSSEPWR